MRQLHGSQDTEIERKLVLAYAWYREWQEQTGEKGNDDVIDSSTFDRCYLLIERYGQYLHFCLTKCLYLSSILHIEHSLPRTHSRSLCCGVVVIAWHSIVFVSQSSGTTSFDLSLWLAFVAVRVIFSHTHTHTHGRRYEERQCNTLEPSVSMYWSCWLVSLCRISLPQANIRTHKVDARRWPTNCNTNTNTTKRNRKGPRSRMSKNRSTTIRAERLIHDVW